MRNCLLRYSRRISLELSKCSPGEARATVLQTLTIGDAQCSHRGQPGRVVRRRVSAAASCCEAVVRHTDYGSHTVQTERPFPENSHLPFRKRERAWQGFRSTGSSQSFFVPSQTNRSAAQIRNHQRRAMAEWKVASARLA